MKKRAPNVEIPDSVAEFLGLGRYRLLFVIRCWHSLIRCRKKWVGTEASGLRAVPADSVPAAAQPTSDPIRGRLTTTGLPPQPLPSLIHGLERLLNLRRP